MKALGSLAVAMALVAGGCGRKAPDPAMATAEPRAAAQPPLPATPSADYARCIAAARSIDPARAACAEDEIGRTQATLSARWRAAGRAPAAIDDAQRAFTTALPLLTPGNETGGTLDRLLAITRAMTLTRARAHLLTGGTLSPDRTPPPLAATARAAWVRSRTTACALAAIDDCDRRYDALLADKDAAVPEPTPPAALTGLPLPTCADVRREGRFGAALADTFDQLYPKPLNNEDAIETLMLSDAQIDNIVHYLACVAGRTDGDVGVAETGLTLFASKRHGPAAMAALDRLARRGDAESASARDYAAQMRAYLDR